MGSDIVQITAIVFGGLICAAVAAQTVLLVWRSTARTLHERRLWQLDAELLRAESQAAQRELRQWAETQEAWSGYRKFAVRRLEQEGPGVTSVYLVPHDERRLPRFQPGQYLTFGFDIPGQDKKVVRCYSLSEGPRDHHYRITVKKVVPPRDQPELPPGRSSSYVNDVVKEGDILDVKAPSGAFYLDTTRDTPVVLIGGGIGITPVLSMMNTIVADGSTRETWFFLGVRNSAEHLMKEHLQSMAREHDNLHINVCYSKPSDDDVEGRDYDHAERVSADLFKRLLPSSNYDFYLCGPPPMMESVVGGLEEWGVPKDRIHFEAFGPATVKKVSKPQPVAADAPKIEVVFAKSSTTLAWDGSHDSLLELAEASGILIDSGCRAGNCGTCLTAIKAGKVEYAQATGFEPEEGSCLPCICVPSGPLELDA